MPQMSPISWILMFFMVYALFMVYNMMNYFSSIPSPDSKISQFSSPHVSMHWKW